MQVESCNLFPMAPVPSSVVTSPLYNPLACKLTLSSSSLLTLAVSLRSLAPFLASHSRTYQRQSNLICSPVRRTLTELNVWFPFISVRAFSCIAVCTFRAADRSIDLTIEVSIDVTLRNAILKMMGFLEKLYTLGKRLLPRRVFFFLLCQ